MSDQALPYDSTEDTKAHIQKVESYLRTIRNELYQRVLQHDQEKMRDPEKKIFDEYTPKLKDSTYGSDEYRIFLKEMKVALAHHYATYRHHPEHFENGIRDMNLVDLIEMFADWLAATKRHDNGDIFTSIVLNKERFSYSDDLAQIFKNTAIYLGEKE